MNLNVNEAQKHFYLIIKDIGRNKFDITELWLFNELFLQIFIDKTIESERLRWVRVVAVIEQLWEHNCCLITVKITIFLM